MNTVTKQFDAGIVSFILAGMASAYLSFSKSIPSISGQYLILLSYLLVAINYAAGAVFGFTLLSRPGFGIYCVVFTLVWIGIACVAFRMLSNARELSSRTRSIDEQDQLEEKD